MDDARSGALPWYEVAFGRLYPVLYAHRDVASARGEAAFVIGTLGLRPGERILDLGCGGGRHLSAFAERGVQAMGIDLSPQLLERARDAGLRDLVRADMRHLPIADAALDAVTSFFSSFGYFPTEEEDLAVLVEVSRVLAPRGRYFLDFLNAERVVAGLVPRSETERAGHLMVEERRIEGHRVMKRVTITPMDGGETVSYEESVHLYDLARLQEMISEVGLRVRASFGGFDGAPVAGGDRVLISAEKA